jgi:thiol-disulfide isomerase/thioredoxin
MTRLCWVAATFVVWLGATAVQAAGPVTPRAGNGAGAMAAPNGTPQQLVAFIQGLLQQRPADAAAQARMRQAVIEAADKILAGRANNQEVLFAAESKANMLQDPQELAAFEESLIKAGRKPAARPVHSRLLAVKLERAAGDATAFRKQLAEVVEYLQTAPFQQGDMQLVRRAGEFAERTGDDKLAGETYDRMADLLGKQASLGPVVKQMQACARRLKLVGNPMRLEGKTLDGMNLDWKKYRGKVVLVDFWATWCGPCMAEVRNIKENYQKYHGKGFEVVGISLDQMNSQQLAAFVQKEAVPWTICRDADSPQRMAEYYGVSSIPNMILVGRDGKVVSLRVRGASLGSEVEKALNAAATDVAAAPDDKAEAKGEADAKGEKDVKHDQDDEKAKKRESLKAKRDEERRANAPKLREWSDTTGKFHRNAKFRGTVGGVVKLELEDGSTVRVPLEKLSEADREYIQQRGQRGR